MFMSHPEVALQPPPEGHISSGCLVVDDTDAGGAAVDTCCWGTCFRTRVRELPFPQNLVLTVEYREGSAENRRTYSEDVVFVPVPGQPLASNRYYVVIAKGKHKKGLVRACSRAEDMTPCCCWMQINDAKPRQFDPNDVYQQIEVVPHRRRRGWFTARAVAADGIPCLTFRKKYWAVYASKPKSFDLGEASGISASLRSSHELAGATVPTGKWYCPFFLVKEDGVAPWQQMDRSMFYELTLVQQWEPVHELIGIGVGGGSKLASKNALIGGGVEATQESAAGSSQHGDAYVWFRAASTGQRVGLCASVWERMRWEEYRRGWVDDEADAENVAGGSVLVERFVFKRMDGSVAVAFDFVHLNIVWEDQL
ncbi:hypothetical protein PR202_gb03310 [Eleusine coracana subsp. coracana]|uniref:Uncharacterized protein n=1 Tax=Eleusine coracana subsp. coracana TaxID=191504 RepID=A0AAV5DZ62_ELECO|nr:hypothetical protein PR202_gb03230 [Eleusine coracana subsp. coracana]GJN16333.1 hypothetical protein PR202_gb03310 [Eleusine coracana subsp. coracana]